MFQGCETKLNSGITVRPQAMKFAMGTSGYVGSIVLEQLMQGLEVNVFLNLNSGKTKMRDQMFMGTLLLKSFYLQN